MPFEVSNIEKKIEEERNKSESFKKTWDESREEYRLIGEMISLRKKEQITQKELEELTGIRQQAISRIEKHENIPSLRYFCNILDAMGYKMEIVKK